MNPFHVLGKTAFRSVTLGALSARERLELLAVNAVGIVVLGHVVGDAVHGVRHESAEPAEEHLDRGAREGDPDVRVLLLDLAHHGAALKRRGMTETSPQRHTTNHSVHNLKAAVKRCPVQIQIDTQSPYSL